MEIRIPFYVTVTVVIGLGVTIYLGASKLLDAIHPQAKEAPQHTATNEHPSLGIAPDGTPIGQTDTTLHPTVTLPQKDVLDSSAASQVPVQPISAVPLDFSKLATHNTKQSCWLLISSKVYDVTDYLSSHPGGITAIIPNCGKDATTAFKTKGNTSGDHSKLAYGILATFYIGEVAADVIPPTVEVAKPANAVVSKKITFTAVAADNTSVAGVQFKLDGVNIGSEVTSGPFTLVWNSASAPNGTHTITAVARDAAGNTKTSSSVTITTNNASVDATSPSVPMSISASAISTSQINLTWNASTDNVGVVGYRVYRGGTLVASPTTASYSDTGLVQGTTYTYTVAAIDAVGNLSAQSSSVSKATLTPPKTTYTSAQLSAHNSATSCWLNVSGKIYDVSAYISSHPGGTTAIIPNCGKDATTAFKTKGGGANDHSSYAYGLLATFYVGEMGSVSSDTVSPVVSILAPIAGTTATGTVTISANATDDTGVVGVLFKIDGAQINTEVAAAPFSTRWNTQTIQNGTHTITAVARDAAGNTKTSSSVTITTNNASVDATSPSVPMSISASAISTSQINLTWNASTDNVGVVGYRVYRGGTLVASPTTASYSDTGLVQGTTYTYTVAAIDAVGNLSAQSSSVSKATLSISGVSYTAPQVAAHNTTSNCWVIISGKIYDVTAHVSIHSGGISTITSRCGADATADFNSDATGHNHSAGARTTLNSYYVGDVSTVSSDTTSPVVTITSPAAGTVTGTVTISANAVDNLAIAGVTIKVDGVVIGSEDTTAPYSVSWNTASIANGAHIITAVARDTSNNSGTSAGVTVTTNNASVDTAPPSTPTGLSATAISTTQINLTWAASTDNVGVVGYRVYRAGTLIASPTTASYVNTGLTQGTSYSYTVLAVDAAGNLSAQSSGVTGTTQTVTGVSYTATQVASHNTSTNCWVIISGKIYDVTANISTHSGGVTAITSRCGTDATTDFNSDATGHNHTAAARATLNGYYVGDLTTVSSDTTLPTVSITAPAAGTVSGTVSVSATAADNVGVAGVTFKVDGVTIGIEDTTAPYSVSWNTASIANGAHTITAVARDTSNNTKTSTAVAVTANNAVVDTAAPTVPTGLTATAISTTQINLAWTASTDSVGVVGYRVYRGGVLIASPTTLSYSNTGLVQGATYSYTIAAIDAAGNLSAQSAAVAKATLTITGVTYTASQVAAHNTATNCWVIISGKIYDVTAHINIHSGGATVITAVCGMDGSTAFNTKNGTGSHAASSVTTLNGYYIGDLTTVSTDTTAPTVSVTAPAAGAVTGTITISANAADNVGVAGVTFKVDGTTIGTEDITSPYSVSWSSASISNGAHSIVAVARDTSSNRATSTAIAITANNAVVDTTPPTVPTGLTATAISTTQINLAWNASTDTVGVIGYRLYRAGTLIASPTTLTYSDTGLSQATSYAYTVAAIDGAGNLSAQSAAVTGTTASASGVSYTATQVATHSTAGSCWVIISSKVYDVTNHINIHSGGAAVITSVCGKDGATAFNTKNGAGSHSAGAITTLNSYYIGNLSAVANDTTPPTVAVTAPAAGTISGSITLSASASDNVSVAGVTFKVDGVTTGTEITSSPYNATWNSASVSNGAHTITAVARDTSNLTTTSAGVAITTNNAAVDTTSPSVPTGLTANVASPTQINLTWSPSTDAGSGIAGYRVYRAGVLVGSPVGATYSDTGLTQATAYVYTVAAIDVAGNLSAVSGAVTATTQTVTYTMAQVAAHNTVTDCWMVISTSTPASYKVFNMTNLVSTHTGGSGPIASHCGADGTAAFKNGGTTLKGHLAATVAVLPAMFVGNLSGAVTTTAPTYTLAQVATHNTLTNCWIAINTSANNPNSGVKVYNVTGFGVNVTHPGGRQAIQINCGKNATATFWNQDGHTSTVRAQMAAFYAGDLVP